MRVSDGARPLFDASGRVALFLAVFVFSCESFSGFGEVFEVVIANDSIIYLPGVLCWCLPVVVDPLGEKGLECVNLFG